jgi:hypothetical protein
MRHGERPPPPSASGSASPCALKHSWTAITNSQISGYSFLCPPLLCACPWNMRVVYICVENGLSLVGTFAHTDGGSRVGGRSRPTGQIVEKCRTVRRNRQEGQAA